MRIRVVRFRSSFW